MEAESMVHALEQIHDLLKSDGFLINIQPGERDTVASILAQHGIGAPEFTPLVRARISHVNGTPMSDYEPADEQAASTQPDSSVRSPVATSMRTI